MAIPRKSLNHLYNVICPPGIIDSPPRRTGCAGVGPGHAEPRPPGPSTRMAIVAPPCPGPSDGANHERVASKRVADPAVSLPADLNCERICCSSARRWRCGRRLDRMARVRPRWVPVPGGPNGGLPKLPALSPHAGRCQQHSSRPQYFNTFHHGSPLRGGVRHRIILISCGGVS
jgi:hypothetical protein